jgi:hypothetical protein
MMIDPSQEPGPNIGEMVLHHTADAWTIPIDFPFYHTTIHLPRWPDVHIGSVTLNFPRPSTSISCCWRRSWFSG